MTASGPFAANVPPGPGVEGASVVTTNPGGSDTCVHDTPYGPSRPLPRSCWPPSLALAGCSDGANDKTSSASDAGGNAKAAAPDTARQEGAAGSGNARNTKAVPKLTASSIIRTASLSVRVKDVPKALDEARTTTENAGGFVGNESTTRDGQGHERTQVVLRVPSDKYDEVLADLEGAGKLLQRTAKAQDVTDQVVDVESRIASQRASVARVRELMDRAPS